LISLNKLNIERIGHASLYLLNNKYKLNYSKLKNKHILYEICPLSNYILHHYIYDNTKLNKMLDNIVIGSDDDNKLNSNLSLDYMFLYRYYKIDINKIKEIIKRGYSNNDDFNKEYNDWYVKNYNILNKNK